MSFLNIATLSDLSNALDTIAKWARVMDKEGVQLEEVVFSTNDRKARRNLAAFFRAGCPEMLSATPVEAGVKTVPDVIVLPQYSHAVKILGKDFIPPEAIASVRGFTYSEEQLKHFVDTLPAQDVLEWARENGFMLVAGPQKPLSLLGIRELKPQYFYTKTGGWYEKESEKFSRDEKVQTKWLMLRKEAVPDSFSKTWDEQQPLLSKVEYVPNDAEVEWGVTTYKAVRDVYLLRGTYVRTASVDSLGRHVYVGFFDARGLDVCDVWGDYPDGDLGVASARNLQIAA